MVQMVSDDKPISVDIEPLLSRVNELKEETIKDISGVVKPPPPPQEETVHKLELPKTMKVESEIFDNLLVTIGELFAIRSVLRKYAQNSLDIELKDGVHRLGKVLDNLYSMVLEARMLPVDDLIYNIPRMIRDLSRERGKEIELTIHGCEIKLDKMVLEKIGDPIIHIIRNAIDHGIEYKEERENIGKPPKGRISINAKRELNSIVLEITDDGKGIDTAELRKKASTIGIPPEKIDKMSDREALLLTCLPGMSLAKKVTDVSGRGVGMDVVKENVESVSGSVEIESTKMKGTTIRMNLPLTVSIIKVILLYIDEETFALPLSKVVHIKEVNGSMTQEAGIQSVLHCGKKVPILSLKNLLGLVSSQETEIKRAVLVETNDKIFGLGVKDTGEEMEAYIKPLVPPLTKVKGVSGATILGNGRPVFLLDLAALLQ
jgi:two-component system chemotaxis sensor kinase CheA